MAGALTAALVWRSMTRPRHSFAGAVVVITGGSRGLGLELARVFAREGAQLALVARDSGALERARAELSRHTHVVTLRADVARFDDVAEALQRVVDELGRIDVLVNNAGVIQVGPIEHMALDDYAHAMDVHFRGPLHTMTWAVPQMIRQGGGRIVNIASVGGKMPVPHLAPYVASKFALVGLSSTLGAELRTRGIRVTTVSPGLMRTGSPINVSVKGRHAAEFSWFALADSLPGLSMSSARAARRIVEACRRGRTELVLGLPARLAAAWYGVAPSLAARLTALAASTLPSATGGRGDEARVGWQSGSRWAPSPLTVLTNRAAERNNELPHATVLP